MFWFDLHWQIQQLLLNFWWPINIFLFLLAVAIFFLAYKKTVWVVALIIVFLPTYLIRSNAGAIPFTYLELIVLLTVFGWVLKLIKQKRKLHLPRNFRWPVVLIIFASTVAIFIAPDLRAAAGLWKAYFIEPIFLFLVLNDVCKKQKNKEVVLWALGISTLTISLLAIYQKFTGFAISQPIWTGIANRRVTAFFTSPNAIGLFLAPITAIYIGWLISGLKKILPSIIKAPIIILNLIAIIFTVSQGTWLGLAAAIIFMAFFGWSKKWTTIIVLALICITLLIPASRQKLLPIATFQDQSGQNRIELWQVSANYLTTNTFNFIFGAGIFGFPQVFNAVRNPLETEPLIYPHNIFLNFWLEIGLLGMLTFVWLIIKFFKIGFRQLKTKNQNLTTSSRWMILGIMAAMVTVVVHGSLDVPYFKNDLAILFWLIISLL